MPHVHNHLTGSHDVTLVALSIAIAAFASFVSLDVAGRLRDARGRARLWWLVLAAASMGGGVWSMHLVAMLAFHMTVPVRYDIALTVLSLVVAVLAAGAGFAIVGLGIGSGAGSGANGRMRLAAAGLFMGFGIAAMHYIGMAAMIMDAVIDYEPILFSASVVIAVGAATAALWLAFNIHVYWQKLLSAAVMAVAISGMHYVGMAAAQYHPALRTPLFTLGKDLAPQYLAVAIAGATFLILLLGLVTVIADRRLSVTSALAARSLELNTRRHRSLIRNSSDVITIIDGRGQFAYCSETTKRILGYAPTWLIGRRMDEFMPPAELGAFYGFLARVQEEQGINMTAEVQLRHEDGQWRVFEITCCNLQGDPGIGGIIANLRDTTDRKRALDELRAAKDLADNANRAKSAFLAAMSHELRTPLNAVIGFSEVIGSGAFGQVDERVLEYVKHIEDSGKHLLSLINDILDLSKAEAGRMTLLEDYIRPADIVADSLRMVGAHEGKTRASLDVSVPASLPYLYGDKRRVKQILINILANAFKFTEAGGRVSLTAMLDAADAEGAGDLLFIVKDSGIGMTADEIVTALEPFRQIDSRLSRKYEGTGLGLPLTKHLIELHGGKLQIASVPGGGTTVTLRFPAARLHKSFAAEDKLGDDLQADDQTRVRA